MNQDIVRGCFSKVRYKNQEKADRAAQRRTIAAGFPIRAYYCGICVGYHLTKRPLEVPR